MMSRERPTLWVGDLFWLAAPSERHEPVIAPGLPPGFPEPEQLVTEDCIRPAMV
jgi:hypothetical protein